MKDVFLLCVDLILTTAILKHVMMQPQHWRA